MKKIYVVLALTLGVLLATFASQNRALAAPPESTPVWRAQFVLRIADVTDAGTNDDVRVQLNTANTTWLDYARNDYERNSNFTYDLVLTDVRKLSDITILKISKLDDDGLCIRSIALIINGRKIYDKNFGNTNSTCLWIDNDGQTHSFTASSSALRAHASWKGFVQPAVPTTLTQSELESRIEGAVGHRIQSNILSWGDGSNLFGRAVEVTKKSSKIVHVDLDLEYDVPIPLVPDLEVDVDFDVAFSCASGKVKATGKNFDAHLDSIIYDTLKNLLPVFGPQLLDAVTNWVLKQLVDSLSISGQFGGTCPVITVTGDGNVVFSKP